MIPNGVFPGRPHPAFAGGPTLKKSTLIRLTLLSSVLAACSPVHEGPHGGAHGGDDPLYEIEPNDDAAHADYLGEILGGDFIAIEGHISECCASHSACCPDPYDGFAFYALEPVSVRITLTEYSPFADLDFAIYLPSINEVVDSFETDSHPEVGVFNYEGPGEFHIVLNSYFGDSSYLLEVEVLPLYGASASGDGPAALAGSPQPSASSELSRERFAGYREQSARVEPAAPAEAGR